MVNRITVAINTLTEGNNPNFPNLLETMSQFNGSPDSNASRLKGNAVYSGLGLLGKELNQNVLPRLKDLLRLNVSEYGVSSRDLLLIATKVQRTIDYGQGVTTQFQQLDKKNMSGLAPEVKEKLKTLAAQISALTGVWGKLEILERSQEINKLIKATQELVHAFNPPIQSAPDQVKIEDMFTGVPSR